jgi:hypothetical protein
MVDTTTATAAAPIPDSTTSSVKPGYKTSEFWLKLGALVLTALFASGVIPTSGPVAQVAAIAATMLGALGYTVTRSMVKNTASRGATTIESQLISARRASQSGQATPPMLLTIALAGLFVICGVVQIVAYSGCAGAGTGAVKTMSGDFATCAKADLGQVIASSAATLLGTVAQAIEGNTRTLEDDFGTLAGIVGADAVKCAIATVANVLDPVATTTSHPSTSQPLPGLQRARAWSAAADARTERR